MKKTLKVLSVLMIFVFIITISPKTTNASSDIKVLLEGKELVFDVSPQIIDGRTLLPLRVIFESLGLTVDWDNETKVITGISENTEIILKVDSIDAKVNGVNKKLDIPAKVINNRTLVPVRFVAESLNMNVVWNQENKTVKISADDIIEWKYGGYEGKYPHKEYEIKYVNGLKSNETRYNGKEHIFSPEDRVISDLNRQVKYIFEDGNNIELNYDKHLNAKFQNTYHRSIVILTDLYYDIINKKFIVRENPNVMFTKKSLDNIIYKIPNEIYVATIIKHGSFFLTEKDYLYNIRENLKTIKNPYYDIDMKYAKDILLKNALLKNENANIELSNNLKKELEANKNNPIKVIESNVAYNSIGTPEVSITIKNLTTKTIKAYEVVLYCYDDFNRPVKRFLGNSNRFDGISQDNKLVSGESQKDTWNLSLYDLTTQVKDVKITYIAFTDGTTWKSK